MIDDVPRIFTLRREGSSMKVECPHPSRIMRVGYTSSSVITVANVSSTLTLCLHSTSAIKYNNKIWIEVVDSSLSSMFCWSDASSDTRAPQYQRSVREVLRFTLERDKYTRHLSIWYVHEEAPILYRGYMCATYRPLAFPTTIVSYGNFIYATPTHLCDLFKLRNPTCELMVRRIVAARQCLRYCGCPLDVVDMITMTMYKLFHTRDYLEYCSHNTHSRY